MRAHHLNASTLCPISARLVNGSGPWFGRARMICHVLVVETARGVVIVDTGLGTGDLAAPQRLGATWLRQVSPRLDPAEPVVHQLPRLGLSADDVTDIVLTHLDLDHAGGLRDFPNATVHVLDTELESATNPRNAKERARYPKAQREGVTFQTHKAEGEDWFGFEAVKNIAGLPEDILMVPLIGHTRGHTGIAVNGPDGWLLHAGDAYFYRGEVETPPSNIFALKLTARQTETIREQRLSNVERLRELKASGEAEVFCAHDPVELARLA